jgi:TonB family protein
MRKPLLIGLLSAALTSLSAGAQTAAAAPSERAQRDADKVFQMILQNADKPRRAVKEDKPVVAAAKPVAGLVAARASGITETVVPINATALPARAAATESAAAAPPTAAPVLAAVSTLPTSTATAPSAATTAALPAVTPALPLAAVAPVTSLAPAAASASRKLELVSSVEPAFPSRLIRQLGSGSVLVNFDVGPDGVVTRTEVARSSHRGLNDAATAAVAAWRFKPTGEALPGVVELKFE